MGNTPDCLRWIAAVVGFLGVVVGWYAGEDAQGQVRS
jgi:hypothetical protein